MKVVRTKDEEKAKEIRKALEQNGFHCPCKVDKTDDTLCMCKEFRDRKSIGPCDCGLYIKTEV